MGIGGFGFDRINFKREGAVFLDIHRAFDGSDTDRCAVAVFFISGGERQRFESEIKAINAFRQCFVVVADVVVEALEIDAVITFLVLEGCDGRAGNGIVISKQVGAQLQMFKHGIDATTGSRCLVARFLLSRFFLVCLPVGGFFPGCLLPGGTTEIINERLDGFRIVDFVFDLRHDTFIQ